MKKDIYIAILEYGKERMEDGITFEKLSKYLFEKKNYSRVNLMEAEWIFKKYFKREGGRIIGDVNSKEEHHISPEGYFDLLSYEQLEMARASARRAIWFAVISIGIACGALIINIFQINKPVFLWEPQRKKIIKIIEKNNGQWESVRGKLDKNGENQNEMIESLTHLIMKVDEKSNDDSVNNKILKKGYEQSEKETINTRKVD